MTNRGTGRKMMVASRVAFKPPAFCTILLMLCTLLLTAASLSAVPHGHSMDAVTCSGDFVLHNNFCYQYFGHSHRPFHHAEKFCSHHKSSLVSIHSLQEEEFIVQLAENNTSFWIGLNDEDGPANYHEEGVFKWTDGNVLTDTVFQNWRPGEPNNRRHLDCVKTNYKGWAMAQGGCAASRLPFVCKKQACPAGLSWSGTSCDHIDTGKMPQSNWLISSHYGLITVFLFSMSVLTFVIIICSCPKNRTPNQSVQDLYPT